MENCANEWNLILLTDKHLLMINLGTEKIENLIIFAF